MRVVVCVLLSLCAIVCSQNPLTIDDFTLGANQQYVRVTLDQELNVTDPPVIGFTSMLFESPCTGLLGCERDMEILVRYSYANRLFTSSIAKDFYDKETEWIMASPHSATATFTNQYDGPDNSTDLNLNGLGNVNLLQHGDSLQITFLTYDIDFVVHFIMYSPNGAACEYNVNIPEDIPVYQDITYTYPLAWFSGNCDFSNIGAIEVSITASSQVGFALRNFSIVQGSGVPSPSATPTPPPPSGPSPVLTIDDFTSGVNSQTTVGFLYKNVNENQPPVYFNSTYVKPNCVGLIGCGRDTLIKVEEGQTGYVFVSTVVPGYYGNAEWTGSAPFSSLGYFVLQYDGMDNSTFLDVGGLGDLDLTSNGIATHLRLIVLSDVATTITVNIFSSFGGVCFFDFLVASSDGYYGNMVYDIPLSDFQGSCEITSTGAIEIFISFDREIDIVVEQILTVRYSN